MTIYFRSSIQNVNSRRFWSVKTNALLNLIKQQKSDKLIDKIYSYAIDLNEAKYQLLIKKREKVGIEHLNDPKGFIK